MQINPRVLPLLPKRKKKHLRQTQQRHPPIPRSPKKPPINRQLLTGNLKIGFFLFLIILKNISFRHSGLPVRRTLTDGNCNPVISNNYSLSDSTIAEQPKNSVELKLWQLVTRNSQHIFFFLCSLQTKMCDYYFFQTDRRYFTN